MSRESERLKRIHNVKLIKNAMSTGKKVFYATILIEKCYGEKVKTIGSDVWFVPWMPAIKYEV